jgi:uncharacterized membrane protein
MLQLKQIWIYLRSSFWFMPAIIVLLSSALAVGLIELDTSLNEEWLNNWPRLFGVGAEGSRGMLSTIAGSIMTMMGVTFSMTLVTLALASSQYTSRILRNFMRSRTTQTVLGIFAGIFIYCLIVLRTIRGGEEEFIPSLAVFVGFILAVAGAGILVLFIHHIASSIQASYIVSNAAEETIETIEKLFPEGMGDEGIGEDADHSLSFTQKIFSQESGYIQSIDEHVLMGLATEYNAVLKMSYGIGEFVVINTPMVLISSQVEWSEELAAKVRKAFSVRRHRTIEQDSLFGIRQIVDVALKALSPGINDTTTAVLCIDYLTSILAHLCLRSIPSKYRYQEGELRVVTKSPNFMNFLHETYDQIREEAKGNVTVLNSLIKSIKILAEQTTDPWRRHLLSLEFDKITEVLRSTVKYSYNKNDLQLKLEEVSSELS